MLTPKLQALAAEAVELIPARHADGDVAWVEVTSLLQYHPETRRMTPAQLAKRATAELDAAAEEYANEAWYVN